MQKIKTVIQSMRPPFLILTLACVFLGASLVTWTRTPFDLSLLALASLGALLAHISVNTLNEYLDYRSGLDMATNKTPFSGGSGALPQQPDMQFSVLLAGLLSLALVLLIGAYFVWQYDSSIIPIGLLGILLIATYTDWVNRHPLICLIAPGAGFGLLMVPGTQFVLLGEYMTQTWLVALVPFFLVNNLLLLNQYPDLKADASVGRYHFPIAYGIKHSNMAYALFAVSAIATIILMVLLDILPVHALVALAPMPLAFYALSGGIKYGETIGLYPRYLAANVAVTILPITLLAASLIYA